jgi:hypothetical protein
MQTAKTLVQAAAIFLSFSMAALPAFGSSERMEGNLLLVPADKLPPQAHLSGQAMTLHLIDPGKLYLYVEQDGGKSLAVFDVTDPHKIRFKNTVSLNARGAFDFVETASPNQLLLRYRDGSGNCLLDLRRPKAPTLRSLEEPAIESYVAPIADSTADKKEMDSDSSAVTARNYEIMVPAASRPVAIIKGVVQQQTDVGNGTTYLLGDEGLTVIRNIRSERRLAGMGPRWTNTIDDN